MKLPFVSRARYEDISEAYGGARATLGHLWKLAEQHRRDYSDLLDKYHSLRAVGASPTGPGLKPEPEPHEPSDLAIEQVVERFGGNLRLRRKLMQFQADARRRDADEDEIALAITQWKDPDEDAA